MLHWSTCNADSQRMFFARIWRHVTLGQFVSQRLVSRLNEHDFWRGRADVNNGGRAVIYRMFTSSLCSFTGIYRCSVILVQLLNTSSAGSYDWFCEWWIMVLWLASPFFSISWVGAPDPGLPSVLSLLLFSNWTLQVINDKVLPISWNKYTVCTCMWLRTDTYSGCWFPSHCHCHPGHGCSPPLILLFCLVNNIKWWV